MAAREHGDLVDRLMARIGELEGKLYDKELSDAQFTIPAIHGSLPSPRTAAATAATQLSASVNRNLLDSLGDPEKQPPTQQPQSRDWRAAASSWLASNPLARSALGSLTLSTTPQTAAAPAAAEATEADPAPGALKEPSRSLRATSYSAADRCSTFSTESDASQMSGFSDPAAAKSPRVSSSALLAAPSSGPSFSFRTRPETDMQPAALEGPSTATAAHNTFTGATVSHHQHNQHSKSNSDSQAGKWGGLKSYYRYIMSPAQGELEGLSDAEVQQVQEAAGAALAEANERLLEAELRVQAAQAAQRQLQQQLESAQQLQEDIEQLKTENLEAWQQKYALEKELATCKANLEGMQGESHSMHQELHGLRQQAQIWCDSQHSEGDKLKAEVELLNTQLMQRSSEVSSVREQLTQARIERDRALQEKQQALEERDRLQQQLQQLSNLQQQLSSLQQQLSSLQQQLAAATSAAAESAASAAEFQEKFIRERAVRRRLHEQLQVLRGNIRVLCRVRPMQKQSPKGPGSSSASSSCCISVPLEGLLCVQDVATARMREFEFDAVFGPDANQQQVFEEVSPLVRSCADGYNACIFAYGQTGSGKTYTMEGPPDNPGINSRALQELFRICAEEGNETCPWSFSVSMMEIYNEAVRDLLALAATGGTSSGSSSASSSTSSSPSNSPPGPHAVLSSLDVSGLPAGEVPPHMDRVPGLVWREVSCAEEVSAVLKEGWRARATAATALNAASSRSHALLCVKVRGVREGRPFTSLLHLVDLAGSERVDKSEVTGQQLKEAQAINKSLSALGDVIAALQRRSPHIPFRNSKLTQVLQDSLCGSSKVLLVCNLSPEAASCGETVSSLNFASRAAQVELGQARRAPTTGAPSTSSCTLQDCSGPAAPSFEPCTSGRGLPAAAAASPGSGSDMRASLRAKSPVYPVSPSAGRSSGSAGGAAVASGTAGAAGLAGGAAGSPRPASRLSDRTSGTGPGLISSGGSMGSPRVSSMAKPARH